MSRLRSRLDASSEDFRQNSEALQRQVAELHAVRAVAQFDHSQQPDSSWGTMP